MSLPPIRRQVVVPVGAEAAFDAFTADIGRWWPVGSGHSVYGGWTDTPTVGFRDGCLVEQGPEGAESLWGTVLDWEPPSRLRITWHPGGDEALATEVEVTFVPVPGERTLVTLEHRGWEVLGDPAAARREYDNGWPYVFGRYAGSFGASGVTDGEAGPVWLALLHTPGPAVSGPAELFGHPDFAEHVAFLRRMMARGVLVAAGPFPASGEGMTVLRLPDAGQVAEYVRLAHEDDQSVARGVLVVRVRPWQVLFTESP